MRHAAPLFPPLLLLAVPLGAQEAHDHGASPYAAMESREIKALSEADVESLLAGDGMSLALAAELNGYPGPRHVLELGDSLGLTAEQREATERVMADMLAEARDLGARIVAAERALDQAFGGGTVTRSELRAAVADLASLRGELRVAHLAAHIVVRDLLTPHQVQRYSVLRGYGGHARE